MAHVNNARNGYRVQIYIYTLYLIEYIYLECTLHIRFEILSIDYFQMFYVISI